MSQTPLVLVHGNPENAGVWRSLIGELDRGDAYTLSPPGFGVPVPSGFSATVAGYRDWLIGQLERFREPVDLVGHDWGGAHVLTVAMARPDLIRSWASDGLGLFAPDYVWHSLAQVWQQEGAGEASVAELFGGDLAQRQAVVDSLGMSGPVGQAVAAGMDAGMGQAVLSLLRSAAQPAMAQAGEHLPDANRRPGLAIIAGQDHEAASGTVEQHQWAADRAGAQVAMLDTVGHWWPVQSPAPVAEALNQFWGSLEK